MKNTINQIIFIVRSSDAPTFGIANDPNTQQIWNEMSGKRATKLFGVQNYFARADQNHCLSKRFCQTDTLVHH